MATRHRSVVPVTDAVVPVPAITVLVPVAAVTAVAVPDNAAEA